MSTRSAVYGIIGIIVVLACAARLVHLDADPYFPTWIGYITDEGRWSEIARNLALFGTPNDTPITRLQLLLSPGYQAVSYVTFRLFGVDFWSARAFSAVSGILIVVVVVAALRRHVTPFALALGAVILGFETNLLAESRMALPEIPSALATLVPFLVLVLAKDTNRNAFIAGMLAAVALGMKGTSLLVIAIFPAIIVFCLNGVPLRARIARAIAFLAGIVLPVVAGLAVGIALGLVTLDGVIGAVGRFRDFLGLSKPYTVVMRFLNATDLEARNLMLLGAWFCSWIWFHRGPEAPAVARKLYLASGAWAGWWLLVWSGNEYLPGRYVVHLVVPATLHIMAGITLAGHPTLPRIAATMQRQRGLRKACTLAWLVLPSAIFGAAVLAGYAAEASWDTSRLTVRLLLIIVVLSIISAAAWRTGTGERVVAGFLVAPVLLTILWLTGREFHVFWHFWEYDSRAQLAGWTMIALGTVAASFALALRPRNSPWVRTVQVCVVLFTAMVPILRSAPAIVAPTYTIRDASRSLGRELASAREIRAISSASLFLENRLRFRDIRPGDRTHDALVILEHHSVPRRFLEESTGLVRAQTFPLMIHPMQERKKGEVEAATIAIYRAR